MQGTDYCYFHDPATVAQRRASRAKGGRARHGRHLGPVDTGPEPVTIERAGDVLPILADEINELRALERSVQRARAIGYLCGIVVKCFDVTENAERFAALESALRARKE